MWGDVRESRPEESAFQREAAICQHRQQTAGGGDARCLNKDWQDGRWQETDFPPFLPLLQEKRLTIRVLWCLAASRCLLSSSSSSSSPPLLFSSLLSCITEHIQSAALLLNLLICISVSSLTCRQTLNYFCWNYPAVINTWCALIILIMIAFTQCRSFSYSE